MEHGPLSEEEMAQIDEILGRDRAYRSWPD
jgi:hypothetical protein